MSDVAEPVGENAISRYYRDLYGLCGQALDDLLSDEREQALARVHAFAYDMQKWVEVIGARTEQALLRTAVQEYQFAILAASIGAYRQAFMALRLAIELCLGAVYFSAR